MKELLNTSEGGASGSDTGVPARGPHRVVGGVPMSAARLDLRLVGSTLLLLASCLVAMASCGSESVEIDSGPDGGDGATPGFSPAFCSGPAAACNGAQECCANVCTGGSCGDPATLGCKGNGGECSGNTDCCSNRCEAGACAANSCQAASAKCCTNAECCSGACVDGACAAPTPGGQCLAPDAACTKHEACCSGRCEPITGQAITKCTDACRGNGLPCTRAQDCCSLGCFAGVCAAQLCLLVGEKCTANAACCSGVCDPEKGECQVDSVNSTCRPTGEQCTSGSQRGCCLATPQGDLCDKTTFDPPRCALPPRTCHGITADCTGDSQCCSRRCDPTTKKCVPSCVPDGTSCAANCGACATAKCDECCGGFCNNGVCSSTPPPGADGGGPAADGKPVGSPCASSAECATKLCLAGFCERPLIVK